MAHLAPPATHLYGHNPSHISIFQTSSAGNSQLSIASPSIASASGNQSQADLPDIAKKPSRYFRSPESDRTNFFRQRGLDPSFLRGKRIRVPVFRQEWYRIKDDLRQGWLNGQWEGFLEGKPAAEVTVELTQKLHADIDAQVTGKSLAKEAHAYLDHKAASPLYRSGENGAAIFSSQSTSLGADIVRAENGRIFQQIPELTEDIRDRIYKEQGVRYQGGPVLGKGAFGQVAIYDRLDAAESDHTLVAAKMSKFDAAAFNTELLENEFLMVSTLPDSANLPKAHGFAKLDGQGYFFTNLHMRGDLKKALDVVPGGLSDAERKTVMRTLARQLVQAVRDMHSRSVYHQDIKPENLLLANDGSIVLSDFGLASRMQSGVGGGTRAYMPPEAKDKATRSHANKGDSDKYAVGRTLADFVESLSDDGMFNVMEPRLQQIINALMHDDPAQRPSLDTILTDPYFRGTILPPHDLLRTIGRVQVM